MEKSDGSWTIESDEARFTVKGNAWEFLDRRADVSWGNEATGAPWIVRIETAGESSTRLPLSLSSAKSIDIATFGLSETFGEGLRCRFVSREVEDAGLSIVFWLRGPALQVYLEDVVPGTSVELFTSGLEMTAAEDGEMLLPIRMGLLLQASAEGDPFDMRLGTYEYEEGVHMAMTALFKSGAALMATWGDPYLRLRVGRRATPQAPESGQELLATFELSKTARSFQLHCLGRGDIHEVAAAYRERATDLGYRVTWDEKLEARPQASRLFGACNVKLWHALARRIDENLEEQSVEVRWTFDEAAQIAEHLKEDLKLEDVLFHLGGWTRYGYDCRHPDIMPANPECGGNEGLADCARRVQACGYLFCLHDNYQDMYRDAPSWDEAYLQKESDGTPHLGGVWLGGRAYYTCAREALKLAQRPQNLPRVREVVQPDLYFIDTTYAVGPQECHDPRHPLTRQEDIRWKEELSDYARDLFGLFGSECGREWAVPHADFFEGMASVRGDYYHRLQPKELGGVVVPFFDMVFRDCIAIHGKYGYNPATMGEQVIHHVAIGRPLYYHALGNHLYWQDPATHDELPQVDDGPDPAVFTRGHQGWTEGMSLWDRFMKNTQEVLGPLYKRTSRTCIQRYDFLNADRSVRRTVFRDGVTAVVNGSSSAYTFEAEPWGEITLPTYGFLVDAGDFVALHATSWNGESYDRSVLFTLTSLDGHTVRSSERVRVFHGFGEPLLRLWGQEFEVLSEAVLQAT